MTVVKKEREKPVRDKTGMRFGRLVVIGISREKYRYKSRGSRRYNTGKIYECKCDCGNIKMINNMSLSGNTVSCGCYKKELIEKRNNLKIKSFHPSFRHGHIENRKINGKIKLKVTITYASWNSLKGKIRKNYYRPEISMAKEWDDFKNFLEDMGEKPPYTRLSRHDKDDDYYKENCYWRPIGERKKKYKK